MEVVETNARGDELNVTVDSALVGVSWDVVTLTIGHERGTARG